MNQESLNPESLYTIAIKKVKKHLSDKTSDGLKKLCLPSTIYSDLDTMYVELPPGWYYYPETGQCVIDKTLIDAEVHKTICAQWKSDNINDYHDCINYLIHWVVWDLDLDAPVVDDTEEIYMNTLLLQHRLLSLLRLGGSGRHPWKTMVRSVSEKPRCRLIKYIKLKTDFVIPPWLKVVKRSEIEKKMLRPNKYWKYSMLSRNDRRRKRKYEPCHDHDHDEYEEAKRRYCM